MKPDLLGMPLDDLRAWLADVGVPATHASRIFQGFHRYLDLDRVVGLGRHRRTIQREGWVARATIVEEHPSSGAVRLVFELHDGARVEGVVLPNPVRPERTTLCVSSQVGCAMGCRFCATGTLGLRRSLHPGEIVAQTHAVRRWLPAGARLSHLVFMGMGEPLHHYDALRAALRVLFDPHGQPFRQRWVTVSTVGRVSAIERLRRDFGGKIQLALSLHAGTDTLRRRLIPAARGTSLAALKAAVQAYEASWGGRIMAEFVVLPGINDVSEELDGVARWMEGLRGVVNLLPFNPFPGAPFRAPRDAEVHAVRVALQRRGVAVTVRWPRGRPVRGACGQLMLAGAGG